MKKMWILIPLLVLLSGCGLFGDKAYTELQPGVDVIEINTEFIDGGCLLYDGDRSFVMSAENEVDVTMLSDQIITYSYTLKDHVYRCYRGVKIIDQTPPSISLLPGIDTIVVNGSHVDAGIQYSDNDSVVSVTQTSTVDTTTVGTYTITYTAIDPSGNQTTMIRVVEVIEE